MGKRLETKLGDHIEINHGFPFKSLFFSGVPTDCILVTLANFKSGGGFDNSRCKYYDAAHGGLNPVYILKPGDIIIALTDLGRDMNILGYAARVPRITGITGITGESKQMFLHNQRIGRVVPLTQKINNDFLYWLMRSNHYHSFIIATAGGSTVKHTAPARIKEFRFLLPPLAEQIVAVRILNAIESRLSLLENTNAFLEKIIMEYFTFFFPNRNECQQKPLMDFGRILCGKTPPKEGNRNFFGGPIPFIKILDLKGAYGAYVTKTAASLRNEWAALQKEKPIPPNSICVSCIGTIGLVSLTSTWSYTNQQINTVIPHHDYQCYYLYCYLKTQRLQLEKLSTGGSILLNLGTACFSQLSVPVPPRSLLEKFYQVVQPIFQRIQLNASYIEHLIKDRNTFQRRIFAEFF